MRARLDLVDADEAVLVLVHVVEHFVQALNLLVLLKETRHKCDDTALELGRALKLHHVVADLHVLNLADRLLGHHRSKPRMIDQVLNLRSQLKFFDQAEPHKFLSMLVVL